MLVWDVASAFGKVKLHETNIKILEVLAAPCATHFGQPDPRVANMQASNNIQYARRFGHTRECAKNQGLQESVQFLRKSNLHRIHRAASSGTLLARHEVTRFGPRNLILLDRRLAKVCTRFTIFDFKAFWPHEPESSLHPLRPR